MKDAMGDPVSSDVMLDLLPSGVIAVSGEGFVVAANRTGAEMFGHELASLIGTHVSSLVPGRPGVDHDQLMARFLLNPMSRTMGQGDRLLRGLRADGSTFPILIRLVPAPPEAHFAVLVVLADQTELQERVRAAEEANARLTGFAGVAAHDLKAPLRRLNFLGEIVLEQTQELDDETRTNIGLMADSAQDLLRLVERLLDFSARLRVHPEQVELRQLVQNLGQTLIEEEGGRGSIEVGELPNVTADPTLLAQVFRNVIGNSLKYRTPSRDTTVAITGRTIQGIVEITIADDGVGFDSRGKDPFEPLRRFHGGGEHEGHGLGLSICRRIIDAHGGAITIESAVGEGTTVTIRLPQDT